MINKRVRSHIPPWQLVLAWTVGFLGVINIALVNIFPLEEVRGSIWVFTLPFIDFCSFVVAANASVREKIARRKIAWILISAASFLLILQFIFRFIFSYDDTFLVFGIFSLNVIGLIKYFPKSDWSLGNIWRVICDVLVLSFSIASTLQSVIYYYFGETEPSRSAAASVVWVGVEIAALINTIFLWHRYRKRILVLIILSALCIVLADTTGTMRSWLSGIYRISGLPDISFNYINHMIVMIFAYYSVNNFKELESYSNQIVSRLEWFYRTSIPRIIFILSFAMNTFVHLSDLWVTACVYIFAILQGEVSLAEQYQLIERLNAAKAEAEQVNAELAKTNARLLAAQRELQEALDELQRRQQAEADLAAERARTAMARDIHDTVGGHLHAASLLASGLMHVEGMAPNIQQMLKMLYSSVVHADEQLRQAITVLNAPQDAPNLPLEEALAAPVADAQQYGLPVTLAVQGASRPIPATTASELVRVTQEALTNARKHAQATEVRITVDYTDLTSLALIIADNGVGMPPSPTSPRADGTGNGLGNMRARVEALGGQFELPPTEQGVTLWMKLPL